MTACLACADPRRRAAVLASALNGLDTLEVLDSEAPSPADRQRILRLTFLKTPPPANLAPANIVISGGDRIAGIVADRVDYEPAAVRVHLSAYGDYSTYRLSLAAARGSSFDITAIDPQCAAIDFSFKVECRADYDEPPAPPLPPPPAAPHIDYLAKDYLSFRQSMLDRLATVAPDWTERNAADLGVTLVELLAHAGDMLSYRQDAIGAESYLATARSRVSVRRHARLVDYRLHEGVNARALIHIETRADLTLPAGTRIFTATPGAAARLAPDSDALALALGRAPEIFETLADAPLRAAGNSFSFYTFGDRCCRLSAGATSAAIKGAVALSAGDLLVFEEVLGPGDGLPGSADPARRWAVRLTAVTPDQDPIGAAFNTPPGQGTQAITRIAWAPADATPFDFILSSQATQNGVVQALTDVSVARGNIVLADHGAGVVSEDLGTVPAPSLFRAAPPSAAGAPAAPAPVPIPARYRPRLSRFPVVHAQPLDPAPGPASTLLLSDPALAVPRVSLTGQRPGQAPAPWSPRPDLISSGPGDRAFVVETDSDGAAFLRFGDDVHGQRPAPGVRFSATYRAGVAARGNVGADALAHIVCDDAGVVSARNPLPARGGVAPETLDHARRMAPIAFRAQKRAVTADDYAAAAQAYPGVRRARAHFRWTGSWSTVFVTVDRENGATVDDAFSQGLRGFLEPLRLAGHDVEVEGPLYVPLEIVMLIAAGRDHFAEDVKAAVLGVFTAGTTASGAPGLFHPDRFTFGQPVYLSPLYAAALAIDGVAAARVTTFQRQGQPAASGLAAGRLDMARLEIARLDNDPDHLERGRLRIIMGGGK